MGLFSKPRFKWKEPLEFMKKRDELTNREGSFIVKLAVMLSISGMMLLVWWVNYIDPEPGKNPPIPAIAIPMGLALGYFVGFLVPIMMRNNPNKIEIYNEWALEGKGSNLIYHHWKQLSDFGISEAQEGPYLWLKNRKGSTRILGIDESIDLQELAVFLDETRTRITNSQETTFPSQTPP